MKVTGAKLILEWENGRRTELGTLSVDSERNEVKGKMRMMNQRIGWDMVRVGMRMMFPRRKWQEETK